MTEDRIEPLCQRLYEAVKADKDDEALALGLELLAGFLVDINRIAWFMQESYESGRHRS
jgi:hypothetical protein